MTPQTTKGRLPSQNSQDPTKAEPIKEQWVKEQLLAPEVAQAIQHLKPRPPKNCLPSDENLVLDWLHEGATFDDLAQLLKEYPSLHAHPLISAQLRHLHSLSTGLMPLSDFGNGVMDLKQEEARKHLTRLLSAWAEGMLPGSQVTITPKTSPGRHRAYDRHEIMAQYKELLQSVWWSLQQQPQKESEEWLRPRANETVEAFAKRIGTFAQKLYSHSSLSTDITLDPQEPFSKETGRPKTKHTKKRLSHYQVSALVRLAIRKKAKSVSIPNLLYGILAIHYNQQAQEIEKVLERAKKADPILTAKIKQYHAYLSEYLP